MMPAIALELIPVGTEIRVTLILVLGGDRWRL